MFNRRVSKTDARVEACGAIDELNSALGVARASAADDFVRVPLLVVQKNLVGLMGEIATLPEDRDRYERDGYQRITPEMTAPLDALIGEIEAQKVSFQGWATPGASVGSAALDLARSVCRRAERRVCVLREAGQVANPEILIFLNRLSDALWLLARWVETRGNAECGIRNSE
jgi:cob(I)alamin adenosyltransferase